MAGSCSDQREQKSEFLLHVFSCFTVSQQTAYVSQKKTRSEKHPAHVLTAVSKSSSSCTAFCSACLLFTRPYTWDFSSLCSSSLTMPARKRSRMSAKSTTKSRKTKKNILVKFSFSIHCKTLGGFLSWNLDNTMDPVIIRLLFKNIINVFVTKKTISFFYY